MMIRVLFIFFCLLASLPIASAKGKGGAGGSKDPMYVQLVASKNMSMNDNLNGQFHAGYGLSMRSIGFGMQASYGLEFHNLWGVRGSLCYNTNMARANFYIYKREMYKFHDIELFADATFDVTDILSSKVNFKIFNCKAYAGLGLFQTFGFPKDRPLSYSDDYSNNPKRCVGVRGGMIFSFKVFRDMLRLNTEVTLTCMEDKFSGVAGSFPFDARANVGIGAIYFLPFKK